MLTHKISRIASKEAQVSIESPIALLSYGIHMQ